nr:M15 family metallopeptidase [uncultured Blautia sp.]
MDKKYTVLINKDHPLSADFIPKPLVDIGLPFEAVPEDPKRLLEEKAARAALELIARSRMEGLNLFCISGYRSYKRQEELYNGNPYVAAPGTSEHQSGLALDLSCPEIFLELTETFAHTQEGIWLKKYAPLYGFIIRYPKNKEYITGFPWEPWHIRYVTKPLASYLTLTGLTLEEYYQMGNNIDFPTLK